MKKFLAIVLTLALCLGRCANFVNGELWGEPTDLPWGVVFGGTAGDMPRIRIHLIEDPEPEGPFGAKGVGEPALVPTAPAILSAIRHATGVRMTEVPVLPHRLMERLGGGEPPPDPLPSLASGD